MRYFPTFTHTGGIFVPKLLVYIGSHHELLVLGVKNLIKSTS
jgi:hypothetical protein